MLLFCIPGFTGDAAISSIYNKSGRIFKIMKLRISLTVFILVFFSVLLLAAGKEKIKLRAHYGFVTAGYADLITSDVYVKDGKKQQHTSLEFKTGSFVEKFFRYNYTFNSEYDPVSFLPAEFSYNLIEKKITYNDTIRYYHDKHYLISGIHGKMNYDNQVRDLLSVIAYLRKINWDKYQKGESVTFDIIFREKEIFPVQIFYQGIENVSVKSGTYECVKLYLTSEAGKLFVSDAKVSIYLSNDKNKVPVSFSTEIFIGSFKLDMVEYENLKYPLHTIKKK